jgi:threonylcarbamoyladenosine tRNA methylthiotransferase MtaB
MQSGDDEVLKRMNRNFGSSDFLDLIHGLRSLIPEAAFTTDILVGFPGETEENFNNTLRLVELTQPSRAHIFPFSARKGTMAYNFKEIIPDYIVRNRTNRLRRLTDKLAREYKSQFIGKTAEVLVETRRDSDTGLLVGYTDTYVRVAFQGPDELKGGLAAVRLAGLTNANSYDILAAHLERKDNIDRGFSEDKLGRSDCCNSFNQK